MTMHHAVEAERLQLAALVEPLGCYGVDAELYQADRILTPWLHIRYGTVTTHGFVERGWYRAFLGMRMASVDDVDAAVRRIAYLAGVPGVVAADGRRP